MWTSSRDELGRSSTESDKFQVKNIGLVKLLTEKSGIYRGIESNIVDVILLIVQVLLYNFVVLLILHHIDSPNISIQPLTRDLASKCLL